MIQIRRLSFALLWLLISVEGGFASVRHRDDWNNWIILQARSKGSDSDGSSNSFSAVRENPSGADPVQIQPYIVTISGRNGIKKDRQTVIQKKGIEDGGGGDLVIPIGQAIEKVTEFCGLVGELFEEVASNNEMESEGRAKQSSSARKIKKTKKKFKKFMLPLLLAYKLKFLTLIPVLIGGLLLLVGTTGLAGFFFALFTAVMSLKADVKPELKQY